MRLSVGRQQRRQAALILVACCVISACKRQVGRSPLAPSLAEDSIVLSSVQQTDGETLKRGTPAHFLVRLTYRLESRDSAVLYLNMDQFANPESCALDVSRFEMKDEVVTMPPARLKITRGTNTLEIPLVWPGDNGDETEGRIYKKGTISVEASMWSEQPRYRFLAAWFGTQFCRQF